jgi:hypothetical protein
MHYPPPSCWLFPVEDQRGHPPTLQQHAPANPGKHNGSEASAVGWLVFSLATYISGPTGMSS